MTILKVRIVATREVNSMGKAKLFKPLYKLLEILPSHFLQINSKPGEIQERVWSTGEYSPKAGAC